MKYNVTLKGKVYEVEIERGEAILVSISDVVAPAPVAAAVPVAAAPAAPVPAPAGAALSGEVIKAPMPGSILKINVNPGDSVKSGQVLLVLEAMKMENDIVAPRDGVVGQIAVAKGAAVDTGAPLMSLA